MFSLFLRKPGSFCGYDAEDAFQNILLKVMTRLFSFKGERLYHPGIPV